MCLADDENAQVLPNGLNGVYTQLGPQAGNYNTLNADQANIPENNIAIKRVSNQREEKVFSNQRIEDNLSPEEFLLKVGKISKSKEVLFETAYNDLSKRNPIEDRIGDLNKFEEVLEGNFNKMDIELDFEYAIFKEENLTKIASEGFEIDAPNYSSLIFKDENDLSNYSLKVNFPARTPFLLSSLIPVIITSVIFTSIIIIAYITTILPVSYTHLTLPTKA